MKDSKLDSLLNEFRHKNPSELQLQKWKRAVAQECSSKVVSQRRRWLELAVACMVGFIIGASLLGWITRRAPEVNLAENNVEHATYEFVLTKY